MIIFNCYTVFIGTTLDRPQIFAPMTSPLLHMLSSSTVLHFDSYLQQRPKVLAHHRNSSSSVVSLIVLGSLRHQQLISIKMSADVVMSDGALEAQDRFLLLVHVVRL